MKGLTYPVVDVKELNGKACMSDYNSHYTVVQSNSVPTPNYSATPYADEVVIFQEDQILPRYIVYFKDPE
jgi:hypothetical protein